MPDFTQGLIYTIRTRNSIYVGSTTNFSDRKRSHKSAIYSETYYDLKLYKTIRDNDGEWYMDKRHGNGTYAYSDGGLYQGQFNAGKVHGQGTYTSPQGDTQQGQCMYGKYTK